MILVFIEKDRSNFTNLEEVLEREVPSIENLDKMEIVTENNEFARAIGDVFNGLEERERILAPSFFFVDPFGFSGIPFEIIRRILSNPKTEVFFTFVVRDIARFIGHPDLEETFTSLFGTDEWKEVIALPDREKALIELYRKQLHKAANVKFSLHFRVCESERVRTLYHLIHATNNFKGHSIMKGIMYNQSIDGSFAYLGPDDIVKRHQMRLFDVHDTEQLKKLLLERFPAERLTYDRIQEKICFPWYDEPPYIDKHYRQALKELEKEGKIEVERITSKRTGLRGQDRITFPSNNPVQLGLPNVVSESTVKIPKIGMVP